MIRATRFLLAVSALVFVCGAAEDKPQLKLTEEEQKVFDLTNEARKKEKKAPLKLNAVLCEAARAHAANMAKKGEAKHELDGKDPARRVADAGYAFSLAGENIAYREGGTVAKVFEFWMGSQAHRENILGGQFTEVGVGAAADGKGKVYYTQVFAAPKRADFADEEQKIVELTNQERAKEKLPPLKPNRTLAQAARGHSANMARQGKMEHTLDGKTPADRVKAAGYEYSWAGENIASGGLWSPADVMKGWMESPEHKANILKKEFTEIGVGIVSDDKGKVYYTQVFGTPKKK